MNDVLVNHETIVDAIVLLVTVAVAVAVQRVSIGAAQRALRAHDGGVAAALLRRAHPSGFALPLLAVLLVIPYLKFPPQVEADLVRLTGFATTIVIAWGIIAAIGLYADIVKQRYQRNQGDLRARQVRTRLDILSRLGITIVVLCAAGAIAMSIPPIRTLGTTLLASAGVAGIVIGVAARPLFENLIAGVQLALSQPIRLDDTVVVEGEQGQIEEISATFVVVRLSDQRRMVLPLTYFIEKPFQNWTRTGPALVGAVVLFVDFSIPVDAVREQLAQILASEPAWDGMLQSVLVTDAKETTMELRILVSTAKASDLYGLRCRVRERLIVWLQQTYRKPVS